LTPVTAIPKEVQMLRVEQSGNVRWTGNNRAIERRPWHFNEMRLSGYLRNLYSRDLAKWKLDRLCVKAVL